VVDDGEASLVVGARLLASPPPCPERVRRLLREARADRDTTPPLWTRGGDSIPAHRFEVARRVTEAAQVAHAQMRRATEHDFPTDSDLTEEQQEVQRAAAAGYLALFPEPARALDVARDPFLLEGLGVTVWSPSGLLVETGDGAFELRRLLVQEHAPRLDDAFRHSVALAATAWPQPPDGEVRIVSANVLTLERDEATVRIPADADDARAWFATRWSELRTAADGPPRSGNHCRDCEFVWACPLFDASRRRPAVAAPPGARAARPVVRLPDVLRITPTALDTFEWCPRQFLLRHVLGIPASDAGRSTDEGRRVHRLLQLVHEEGSCHDAALVDDVLTRHGADDDAIRSLFERHRTRCPHPIEHQLHETARARYHHRPVPYFLATAQPDAIWVHDGVLDVRDYKTGRDRAGDLRDDVRAQVQAWVWAGAASYRGLRLRIRYEYLAAEVEHDPEPWEPDDDDLVAIEESLRRRVESIRRSDFAGIADDSTCKACPFRSVCRDSAAPGVPVWPALSLAAD
jgi:CRISPR/Cas system-associated exonuclease Cas4 (RecB family)